ncbi:MAG: tyrosine-type recombinase/integrase [Methylophaga sp.]|nr:tyrosine-type recombinase/integrase [Methylophaga sp.]
MASIRFRNSKYQVLIRMHGISTSKTFTKKIHAQHWAKSIEVAIESGQYKIELDLTVKQALLQYMSDKISHDKSSHSHVRNAIVGLGSYKADTLTSHQLVLHRNARLLTHSPQTVKHELSMVLRALKWARDELGYSYLKIPTIKMPSLPRGRDRRITRQEETKLFHALRFTSSVRDIVSLAIETGMRRSELISMRWGDINLKTRTLHIPKTKTDIPRTIPLTVKAAHILGSLQRNISGEVFSISAGTVSQAWTSHISLDSL